MTNVRAETHEAILKNDLSKVVFTDPFSSVTRQAKRNTIVAAFVALLISLLELKITGFLGLQASTGSLGSSLAQGIACLVVLYFLIGLVFHIFVDYTAWQFHLERQATKPYADLIQLLERQVAVLGEHIVDATRELRGLKIEGDMQSQIDASKKLGNAEHKLTSIDQRISGLVQEVEPLLQAWAATVQKMKRLDARLRMRMLSLWCLDIIFPLGFALIAVIETHEGIVDVLQRIVG